MCCTNVDFQNVFVSFLSSSFTLIRTYVFILTKCPDEVRYIFGNLIYFYLFILLVADRDIHFWSPGHSNAYSYIHTRSTWNILHSYGTCVHAVPRLIRRDLVSSNTNRNDLNQSCAMFNSYAGYTVLKIEERKKFVIKRNTHSAAWQLRVWCCVHYCLEMEGSNKY